VPHSRASLWAEPAISNRPERSRRDAVLAAAVATGTVIEVAFRSDLVWPALGLVLGLALAGGVLIRRQRPLGVVLFGFGGFVAIDVATLVGGREPFVLYSGSVVLVLAFALFRWGSARHAAIGLVAIAATLVSTSVVDYTGVGDVVGGAAVLLLVAVLGASIRYRHTARDQLVEQAKSHERQQIARELHDTVAHHVSAIAVQAQAGLVEVDARSFTGAADALQVIADEATRTLTEMRSMVGMLRDDRSGTISNMRGPTDIEQLASRGTADTTVVVRTNGDLTGVTPMVAAALYRVAQESVTNALRHARHASRIVITVETTSRDVTLSVSDNGDATGPGSPSGYGLTGMGERIRLLGGVFEAGPAPSGGWTVCAVLPR
jgi:signal transduction histidine kinase